jgi:UDP-N-acetylglucosamine 2-epimerase (non-hydrolysing)
MPRKVSMLSPLPQLSPVGLIVHIAGARPNFPKAAPVIAALEVRGIPQVLIHTGQHYDERLSEVFFRQLGLPEPDLNLGVGSGSHAEQTAAIMVGLEPILRNLDPALVVVYGDVNSTLAASLVAAKLLVPVAHVEAGLRSFDNTMPEEINRRLTDQLCDLLFVTSPEAVGYLANEGLEVGRIHFVGNPMIDTLLANLHRFDAEAARRSFGLPERYVAATLHRPSNVDSWASAAELVRALHEIADEVDLVIPLHPRGRGALEDAGLSRHPRVHVEDPVGYVEFISLVRGALVVLTDSGGVQEETTVLGVPCLTMRPNTERPVTITHGTNQLVTTGELVRVFKKVVQDAGKDAGKEGRVVPPLWDGHAGGRIADVIVGWLEGRGGQ